MTRLRQLATFLVVSLVTALSIAGCGGHSTSRHVTPRPAPTLAQVCPAGHASMGCASRLPSKRVGVAHPLTLGGGGLFPDVSSYQGALDWGAVKSWQVSHGWRPAGIFKLGEYVSDPYAARNASETARLGVWRAGYWFVRNTGCGHEAGQIISAGRAYGLKVLVLDIEVPEAAGYSTCLVPAVRTAGFIVVIYTGTGTWPGGTSYNAPLWIAAYGSGFGCIWTCHPVAWQFSDGTYGNRTYVPGIGYDDINIDYGLTSLGAKVVPTDTLHRAWYAVPERSVVEHYDGARRHPQRYATYLRKLEHELGGLAHHVLLTARAERIHGHPSWGVRHRGWRFQELIHRAEGKRVVA